jgi:hypothetical protein
MTDQSLELNLFKIIKAQKLIWYCSLNSSTNDLKFHLCQLCQKGQFRHKKKEQIKTSESRKQKLC